MAKYIVPIEAWVEVEAKDADAAWEKVIQKVSTPISELLEEFGDCGVEICEPNESEEEE